MKKRKSKGITISNHVYWKSVSKETPLKTVSKVKPCRVIWQGFAVLKRMNVRLATEKGRNNMKVYGYARISRKQQSIDRQIRNIKEAYPSAVIAQEAFTGTKLEGRKEFEKILKAVKPGDMIVFNSVSRMSRNAEEGFALYQELLQKGIDLVFLKEPHINTSVYREAADKQIDTIQTGDAATDELMAAITAGINR